MTQQYHCGGIHGTLQPLWSSLSSSKNLQNFMFFGRKYLCARLQTWVCIACNSFFLLSIFKLILFAYSCRSRCLCIYLHIYTALFVFLLHFILLKYFHFRCKNFRVVTFLIGQERDCHDLYSSLLKLSKPGSKI